jgi:hypothetical protein
MTGPVWLEPWLDDLPANDEADPESAYLRRESVELAFRRRAAAPAEHPAGGADPAAGARGSPPPSSPRSSTPRPRR